jgi:peptide/nickel transport system substrate-binding protein
VVWVDIPERLIAEGSPCFLVADFTGATKSLFHRRGTMSRCAKKLAFGYTVAVLGVLGCTERGANPSVSESTVVIAAIGEPTSLIPPLVYESLGRDISDLIYERLAELQAGHPPLDSSAYRPRLAASWERLDSLTWRFHLRPGAQWHDGTPVTAEDVAFSFEVFTDPVLDAPARTTLAGQVRVLVEDSATFRLRFSHPSPEQLYDGTYFVRIMPKHVWAGVPKAQWSADTARGRLVGSGPYRLREWKRGEYTRLDSVGSTQRPTHIAHLIWRFTKDPEAALNLVLSHEAQLLETVPTPAQQARFTGDTAYELRPYPSAVFGYLAFRVSDAKGRPHPIVGNREIRRALVGAIDRPLIAQALFGRDAKAPPGPMSRLLWIWDDSTAILRHDPAAASQKLDASGWRLAAQGLRQRAGRPLHLDILVPSTSTLRKNASLMVREAWRKVGVDASVTAVDFPVFQERLRRGQFDAYIGAYLDEPSARALADQWTHAGWGNQNFGHYGNAVFDSLLLNAGRAGDLATARRLYREAMDTLNADAPAAFLYAPSNMAAISRSLSGVEINPFSWLSGLPDWEVVRSTSISLAH